MACDSVDVVLVFWISDDFEIWLLVACDWCAMRFGCGVFGLADAAVCGVAVGGFGMVLFCV